jgi:hypothetical protein
LESAAEKPAKPMFTPQATASRALMASKVLPANAGIDKAAVVAMTATAASFKFLMKAPI